jgi:CelD/BcsL family acetyltransferase involved in cellulose biosynthesis
VELRRGNRKDLYAEAQAIHGRHPRLDIEHPRRHRAEPLAAGVAQVPAGLVGDQLWAGVGMRLPHRLQARRDEYVRDIGDRHGPPRLQVTQPTHPALTPYSI